MTRSLVVVACFLAACGGNAKPAPAAAPANTAEATPPPPPERGPTAASPVDGRIPACAAYVTAVERYLTCDKIPAASRDAARQGIDAMKSGWLDLGAVSDEVIKANNDACAQATDAIHQAAGAMGCAS